MRLSIRSQLALLWWVGSFLPIVTVVGIVGWSDVAALKRQMLAADQSVAEIVSGYASGAILMEDAEAAAEDLAVVARLDHAVAAAVYERSGDLFAKWQRPGSTLDVPPRYEPSFGAGVVERSDHFVHIRPVIHQGKEYGTFLLLVSREPLNKRIHTALIGLLSVGGMSIGVALVLSLFLQRLLSRRILALAQAARQITKEANYTVRVPPGGDDELGELAGAFNQMLEEIGKRQKQAEDAIRLRDEFILVAAHELKTPLASLGLSLQLLERGFTEGRLSHEALVDIGKSALRQAKRLRRLISNLLDVANLSAGCFRVMLQEVDLAALIRDVVTDYQQDFVRAGSTVNLDLPEEAKGKWDPSRLEQLLGNLLSNALKYGAGGSIEVTLKQDAEHVQLTVRDSGIGIAAEDRERIFKRFERAVSHDHYGGLGLGLHIVQGIVAAHRGTITVESEPNKGAAFIVVLPKGVSPEGSLLKHGSVEQVPSSRLSQ